MRGMPLGTRLRSAWLALFASPACAAVMQPRPPSRRVAWLRPLPAPQSQDCVRGRVHRHAILRVRRARLKAAAFPAQHIRSALGFFSPLRRRTAGYRAPVRRKAHHPLAGYGAIRLGPNTALKRLAAVPAASAVPRRPCSLRLVPPPPRPALRTRQAQDSEPKNRQPRSDRLGRCGKVLETGIFYCLIFTIFSADEMDFL